MKKEYTILKALIEGSPERAIYLKGKEDAKNEAISSINQFIKWLTGRILNFREINHQYKDIYDEKYIRGYEEVLTKILTGETV